METKAKSLESAAILEYLRFHREFFADHPDILMELEIPHLGLEGSVSLIERQVAMLRGRNGQLERQLGDLLEMARENDRLSERMHRFAQSLLEAEDLDAILDTIVTRLYEDFRVEYVSLRAGRPDGAGADGRAEWMPMQALRPMLDLLPLGKARVGVELAPELMETLFGKASNFVHSLALLPLHDSDVFGLVALGSRDRDRYNSHAGTLILNRVGELASAALKKWMHHPV